MSVAVRDGWVPGVVGEAVRAHAVFYAREWGFGPFFEVKVAREMGAFLLRYDPAKDRMFRAGDGEGGGGRFLGSLAVDGGDPELAEGVAHLRWFIVADGARGRGVGGALMRAGLHFLAGAGFRSCHLATFAGLAPAHRLHEGAGFVLSARARPKAGARAFPSSASRST